MSDIIDKLPLSDTAIKNDNDIQLVMNTLNIQEQIETSNKSNKSNMFKQIIKISNSDILLILSVFILSLKTSNKILYRYIKYNNILLIPFIKTIIFMIILFVSKRFN